MAWLRAHWGVIVTVLGLLLGTNGAQYADRVGEPGECASDLAALHIEIAGLNREIGRLEGRME